MISWTRNSEKIIWLLRHGVFTLLLSLFFHSVVISSETSADYFMFHLKNLVTDCKNICNINVGRKSAWIITAVYLVISMAEPFQMIFIENAYCSFQSAALFYNKPNACEWNKRAIDWKTEHRLRCKCVGTLTVLGLSYWLLATITLQSCEKEFSQDFVRPCEQHPHVSIAIKRVNNS